KYGHPLYVLGMPKAMRDRTGKGPGDTIEVAVWKDEAERIVEVPAQFENLMKKEGLLPVFKKLSYAHRKECCRWLAEAKKEETRLKRLEKAIEMISTPGQTIAGLALLAYFGGGAADGGTGLPSMVLGSINSMRVPSGSNRFA